VAAGSERLRGKTARPCGRGKAREGKRSGVRVPLPHRGAPAALIRRREAMKWWRGELPSLAMVAAVEAWDARVCGLRQRLRVEDEDIEHRGGLKRRG
jgi:hypothetical protein